MQLCRLLLASADTAFVHGGREYPGGTLIFRKNSDIPDLSERLAALADATGAEVVGIDDSWVTDGPSFGSEKVVTHLPPRIAIAWDRPTRSTAAGNTRFVIERELGYPVTPVRTRDLASPALAAFDVVILPDGGGYGEVLGEEGATALRDWVQRGGVLIGMGRAVRMLANPEARLASIRREAAFREDEDAGETADEEEKATVAGVVLEDREAQLAAQAPREEVPDEVQGVLARVEVDPDHWLAAGVKPMLNVLVRGTDIYTPVRLDAGANVASFAAADDLVASGYLWEENRRQLAFKPFVVVEPKGRGFVIAFTQDPTVRAYLNGLNVLFANALFRAPAHAQPSR